MRSARDERLERLFDEAVELDFDRRPPFLEEQCADDPALRAELERLLASDASAGESVVPLTFAAGEWEHDPLRAGEVIGGRYTLIRQLGAGGMGVVWLAEQATPRREVALKVLREGLVTPSTRRRFEMEAAVLGRLQHSGIAQIYEAGTHGDGAARRPYFAMELVDGQPLQRYLASRRMDIAPRLQLFALVCDAVHHAHQKGVIHRDLKPGNILVTADGRPKVLDFGVARAAEADLQLSTIHTHAGQLIGTLPYMSPEQVRGRGDDLDTRSDVYALGVLLYQVLADRLPYDLGDHNITAAARVIAEQEPTPLAAFHRAFRGDLNTIVLKALEKDPARRYQSASDLAADVRRYLHNEPIVARPASALYSIRKFAGRNKGLVAGALLAFGILIVGVIGTTMALVRARDAAQRAGAINEFMTDLILSADPEYGRADIRLVDALRSASDTVSVRFTAHPEIEADVRGLLARAFHHLKQKDEELQHASREYELRKAMDGMDDPETRIAGVHYVQALVGRMDLEAARNAADDVLAHTPPRQRSGQTALELRRIVANIHTLRRENDAARADLRSLLPEARAALGPDHPTTLAIANDLAWGLIIGVLHGKNPGADSDVVEAIEIYRDTLARLIRTRGESDGDTLNVNLNLAEALRAGDQRAEAAQLAQRALELAPPRFGADHQFISRAARILGDIAYAEGRLDEAADYRVRAVEAARSRERGVGMETLTTMSDGLALLDAAGRLTEGEAYARSLYERFEALGRGRTGSMAAGYRLFVARFLSRQGKFEEASQHFAALLAQLDDSTDPSLSMRVHHFWGAQLLELGRLDEAEPHLLEAVRLREFGAKPLSPRHEPVSDLVQLYDRWGKAEEAETWRRKAS